MELVYSPRATKQLQKIGPAEKKKSKKKIEFIRNNPLIGKQLTGDFALQRDIRAWPLRVIYSFDLKSQTITIADVDYRGRVYKKKK